MNKTDFFKLNNCRNFLNDALNRMSNTDDFEELKMLCFFAVRFVNDFYDLNYNRLLN